MRVSLLAGLTTLAVADAALLPQVDLGYVIQQATTFNAAGDFYRFDNIRYAAPPTGKNRFIAPQPPAVDRSKVENGLQGRVCPQGLPAWTPYANTVFVPAYFEGKNVTDAEATVQHLNETFTPPPRGLTETEDCLFLDVVTPKSIFEKAKPGAYGAPQGAPVLVWIYGGGYVTGSKTEDPIGLFKRSQSQGQEGIVFVALNYRLGALGWLAGPSFVKAGGLQNAGLYDQRFALEWVQKNIAKFGGDPSRVTVMGESAGGGSILHQITAYGGRKPAPFQRAILQSPGWQPLSGNNLTEGGFHEFLRIAGTTSLSGLQALSTDALLKANAKHIGESMYGSFQYGPAEGCAFVPDAPPRLLAAGEYAHSVHVMTGHNTNEGILFTSPYAAGNHDFMSLLADFFPGMTQATKNKVVNELYPPSPQTQNSLTYTTETQRISLFIAELFFVCNTYYLERASNFSSYSYLFNVGPSYHGEDVPFTFFDDGAAQPSSFIYNTTVAEAMQDYLTSFAQTGKPTSAFKGLPMFNMYGSNAQVQEIDATSITQTRDPAANARCQFWETVPY